MDSDRPSPESSIPNEEDQFFIKNGFSEKAFSTLFRVKRAIGAEIHAYNTQLHEINHQANAQKKAAKAAFTCKMHKFSPVSALLSEFDASIEAYKSKALQEWLSLYEAGAITDNSTMTEWINAKVSNFRTEQLQALLNDKPFMHLIYTISNAL